MAIYSSIKIALSGQGFKDLLKDRTEAFKGTERLIFDDKFLRHTTELKDNDNDSYFIISNDCIVWDTASPEVKFMDGFLRNHRHSFIRIGEEAGDIITDIMSDDKDGCDEMFEGILDVRSEILVSDMVSA